MLIHRSSRSPTLTPLKSTFLIASSNYPLFHQKSVAHKESRTVIDSNLRHQQYPLRFPINYELFPSMATQDTLGIVLVTGGCGYIGSRIVQGLLAEPSCSAVHVISRNPNKHLYSEVQYHTGDISDLQRISQLLGKIKPKVIIHCAGSLHLAPAKEIWHANVTATRVLLEAAASNSTVHALVFPSSDSAIVPTTTGIPQTEASAKLYAENDKVDVYSKSKAVSETEVLAANKPGKFHTVALRVPICYGPDDDPFINELLRNLQKGQQRVQLGENKLQYEFLYIKKGVEAHTLAAKALLKERNTMGDPGEDTYNKQKVSGEAFFISDGNRMPFFDFARKVYGFAGHPVAENKIKVMPLWFLIILATFGEWIYWVFTAGKKTPELRRRNMEYYKTSVPWKIDKAKEVLGYEPVVNQDEAMRQSVESGMKHLKM